jgi:hypothetical protein
MAMEGICKAMHGVKAGMLMVVVQFAFAGVNVFYKLASNNGMSLRVVIAYRFIFATLFVLPIALVFERYIHATLSSLFQSYIRLMHIRKQEKQAEAELGSALPSIFVWPIWVRFHNSPIN